MTNPTPHYSASQLATWERCAQQWAFRYIDNLKLPPGISLIRGKSVDKSVGANLTNKISTGELLKIDQVQDIARDEVLVNFQQEVKLEEDYEAIGLVKSKALTIDQSVKLASYHHENIAVNLKPKAVQEEFKGSYSEDKPQLVSYVDIIETNDTIRDTKTSGRSKNQDDVDNSQQLTIYDYMFRQKYLKKPKALVLDNLVINSKNEVKHQTLISEPRAGAEFTALFERLNMMDKSIKAGIFQPAAPDSWQCSKKWCGYYGICRFAGRK